MERAEVARIGAWAARQIGVAVARAAGELGELVPPESRVHLLKAQREVYLAAAAAMEHRHHPKETKSRRRAHKIVLD
ncbi:MAG TPA: hypothetical protein VNH38_08265 [Candidatus Dormibacteraeota bacterium]|nr:hypothetical protein [Candidatus Dormibacteraeota bacterium]